MDSQEGAPSADLLGPFIDRTFRLVEMIGIIALLAVALKNHSLASSYVTFFGELLAFIYWLEPITNRFAEKVCGSRGPKTRLLARLAMVFIAGAGTIGTVPYVRQLTESLKHVI